MAAEDEFVEALLVAPVGVAMLGMLEARFRDDVPWWEIPAMSDPLAVRVAAKAVTAATLGWLLSVAVDAAAFRVGPWIPSAANDLAKGYRLADARTPIAQAIADRFGAELHRGFDANVQEWWVSYTPGDSRRLQPGFRSLDRVYCAGQFTLDGLWTVSGPSPEVHADLAGAWELETGPISRWRLPVNPQARIAELHRPQHWASLVTTYPTSAAGGEGWELPGVNQRPTELTGLLSLPTQRGGAHVDASASRPGLDAARCGL